MFNAEIDAMLHRVKFDSDSFIIGIDNHALYCMPNKREHFEGPLKPMKEEKLRGISRLIDIAAMGTLVWQWEDDVGWVHTHKIPNSLLVPDVPFCVLSPPHWAQERKDHFSHPN
eukprot:9748736-Ditylum_brightwellii.AAC.1